MASLSVRCALVAGTAASIASLRSLDKDPPFLSKVFSGFDERGVSEDRRNHNQVSLALRTVAGGGAAGRREFYGRNRHLRGSREEGDEPGIASVYGVEQGRKVVARWGLW